MRTIDKTLLLLHQHVHMDTPDGIGTYKYIIGMIRLMSDPFSRAVNLTPVFDDSVDAEASVATYPDNVECKVLYRRGMNEPTARVAMRHLAAIPSIAREIARADVIQIRLPSYPAVLGSLIALALRKPMLVSIHGNWGEVFAARHGSTSVLSRSAIGLARLYHRAITRASAATLVVGERGRSLAGDDAVVFGNHQFEPDDLYHREDTCTERPVKLLFVGTPGPRKGTDILLDAVKRLRDQGVDCRLSLVGIPRGFDVHAESARRGLGDVVDVPGQVEWGPALFALYRHSDIFVFPPPGGEGSPKAPMEALSQCVPVVATPVGSSDFIQSGESGLLVPPGDAPALAEAIARMIDDGALRRRCIAGGFEVAKQHTRTQMQARVYRALRDVFDAS